MRRRRVFKIAFVLIAGLIAAKLLSNRASWVVCVDAAGSRPMRVYGFLIGLSSALMGVGGGSLSTMTLTLYGQPLHNAIATSAGIGVPITVAGTIGYMLAGLPHLAQLPPLSIGFVSIIGVVLMAPISSLVAPFGARLDAQPAEAAAGDRVRRVPAGGGGALPGEPA